MAVLELHGDRPIEGNLFSAIRIYNNGATPVAAINAYRGASDTQGEMTFLTSNSERMRITSTGNVGIGTTTPTHKFEVNGDAYISGDVSALTFTDRTPYPKDLETAYKSVLSMMRLPEGEYNEDNKEFQLDHSKLADFIKSGEGRDLSATVSAQNEVIKDLIKKNDELTKRIEVLEKR